MSARFLFMSRYIGGAAGRFQGARPGAGQQQKPGSGKSAVAGGSNSMVNMEERPTEIVVSQPQSLDDLPGLARALEAAFRQTRPVVRLVIATDEVPLPLVQLICAAHRSAQQAGAEFTVEWQEPGPVQRLLQAAGFSRHVACPRSHNGECLWLQENWL